MNRLISNIPALCRLAVIPLCLTSVAAFAASEQLTENSNWPKDSWHLEYEYDDFSDKVLDAKLIYLPADYGSEKAYLLRCQPYFTNFAVGFLEQKEALLQNGKLHNNAQKFDKHGFIYSQERDIQFRSAGRRYSEEVEVGGQIRGISQWIRPAQSNLPDNALQMNLHGSMIFSNIPSFTNERNSDFSEQLFVALQDAINQETTIEFTLEMPNGKEHHFSLDGKRLKNFAPIEVLDFCLLKRQLRDD